MDFVGCLLPLPNGVGLDLAFGANARHFVRHALLAGMPAKGSDRRPDRDARKGDGEAFFHALLEGHDRALPKLIKRNRKLLDVPSVRELMQSAHQSKSAKLLPRERKGSTHDHIPESSPLVFALRFGHTAVVRALLAAGADPNGTRPVLTHAHVEPQRAAARAYWAHMRASCAPCVAEAPR